MREPRRLIAGCALLLAASFAGAQDVVTFGHLGRTVTVGVFAGRVEVLPVIELIGGQGAFSPAAGTYRLVVGEREVQLVPERKMLLVNGELVETLEAPVASPGGAAVSLDLLDRSVLAGFGLRLERRAWGYEIVPGVRPAAPLPVRPAVADFPATTTIVLTLGRQVEAQVEETPTGAVAVRFRDAVPVIDGVVRSSRVRQLVVDGGELRIELADGAGLRAWHRLDNPPRVIVELGRVVPTPTPAPVRTTGDDRRGPIVIDPGHGGDDTGAVGPDGRLEKDLVLQVARRVAGVLEARGHFVRLTRTGDETRALTDRTALANRLEARGFISLHANASTVAAVRGAETYYMSLDESASDAHAAATAELENRSGGAQVERSALDLILWDLAQAEVLNESARFALAVQRRLNALLGSKDRGVKQAPFVVLTGATMPAVLVEVGFLSNPDETRLLEDPDYQQRLAEALALGIEDFVGPP